MNSIYIVIVSFFIFYFGYRYYSKYIANKIFNLDDNNKTPAHTINDGVDYVPAKKHILFGHHCCMKIDVLYNE